jgi:hypothetical protein
MAKFSVSICDCCGKQIEENILTYRVSVNGYETVRKDICPACYVVIRDAVDGIKKSSNPTVTINAEGESD